MKKYIPNIYQKNIYLIDYSKLLSNGINTLLFDLDNTILSPGDKEISPKVKDLFISLKQKGFKIIIFSNSYKRKVNKYKDYLGVKGVYFAFKPFTKKFKEVIKKYNLDTKKMAIIGDQLLTDVLGGNKIGITTILVNPLSDKDSIFTIFNRSKEKRIMKKLKKEDLFVKGRYYEKM
ncbi:MAG: YqeG family HAD IIIA-type phosphatase [Bacilli bacterium]|nr:YqeG family HAD IIIA-type phosphatase [Bacilli bacterium]